MNTSEYLLIGMILSRKGAFQSVQRILRKEDLVDPAARRIWDCLALLDRDGLATDIAGVAGTITRLSPTTAQDDMQLCFRLLNECASTANLIPLANSIAEQARCRHLSVLLTNIAQQAGARTGDSITLINALREQLNQLVPTHLDHRPQLLTHIIQANQQLLSGNRTISGLVTGFGMLDRTLGGLHDTDLIIIGARPGEGKTTLGVNLLLGLIRHQVPCAMFSIEMAGWQIARKVLARGDSAAMLQTYAPFFLADHSALDIHELRQQARQLVQEQGVRCLLIDYLQLVKTGEPTTRNTTREQEVSKISAALKALAKELNIVVIALCQMNRAIEQRKTEHRRPMLSDLRESGAIEQDADVVLFLDPGCSSMRWENSRRPVNLIIAKHRNGQLRDIPLVFTPSQSLFQEYTSDQATTLFPE